MRKIFAVLVFVVVVLVVGLNLRQSSQKSPEERVVREGTGIRYVPVGDSYTIGLGILEKDRWPNVLTQHLIREGIDIELVSNPSVSGYTVQDAIRMELVEVKRIKPDFVTVLIGTNDNFVHREVSKYRSELRELLDRLQDMMTNPRNIVLITIPDYTMSPARGRNTKEATASLIREYNEVILDEGKRRGLAVADIYPISQTMTEMEDYYFDGLHPSAQGYLKWERVIYPVVLELISKM